MVGGCGEGWGTTTTKTERAAVSGTNGSVGGVRGYSSWSHPRNSRSTGLRAREGHASPSSRRETDREKFSELGWVSTPGLSLSHSRCTGLAGTLTNATAFEIPASVAETRSRVPILPVSPLRPHTLTYVHGTLRTNNLRN